MAKKITEMSGEELSKKSTSELYTETKFPEEVMKDIQKIGDVDFEKLVHDKFKLNEQIDNENKENEKLKEAFDNIIQILKEYLDWTEDQFIIAALWIIGTYFHKDFPTFPYLFLNATKGSGKSRGLNLITFLSKDGDVLNALTEAVLFRSKGTLGIDEFEGLERKGKESLKELLNSAYKKGVKVKRMKKVKTLTGEEQVIEEFDVYRPIVMANISGMENVLGDRCIPLIIEKSSRKEVINLIELFREEEIGKKTKELLSKCRMCTVSDAVGIYTKWNNYVKNTYTSNTTYTTYTTDTSYTHLFKRLKFSGIEGRYLELSFPLLLIATLISSGVLERSYTALKSIFEKKKEEEFSENIDVSLIDFVSQYIEPGFVNISKIVSEFRAFINSNEEWITPEWMGRALRRLNLIKEKRRLAKGREIVLDINHAQEKITMFR